MDAGNAATLCDSSVSSLASSLTPVGAPEPVSAEAEDVSSDGRIGNCADESAGFLTGEDNHDEFSFAAEGPKTSLVGSRTEDFCGGVVEGIGSLVLEKFGLSEGEDNVDPKPEQNGVLAGEERDLVSEEGSDTISELIFPRVVESTERKEEDVSVVAMVGSEVEDGDSDGKIESQANSEIAEAAASGIAEAEPKKDGDLNDTEPVESEPDDESLESSKADTTEAEEIGESIPPHKSDGIGGPDADDEQNTNAEPSVGVHTADQVVVENSLREDGEFSFVAERGDDNPTNLTFDSGKEGSSILEWVPEDAVEMIDIEDWDLKEDDDSVNPESKDSMPESRPSSHEDCSLSPKVFAPVVSSLESTNLEELRGGSEITHSGDEPKKMNLIDELKKVINLSEGSSVGVSDDGPMVISDYDEAMDTENDDDDDGEDDNLLFDSVALTALLKAAAAAEGSNAGSQNTSNLFSGNGPAGLGSSVPMLQPSAPRRNGSRVISPFDFSAREPETESMNEEEKQLSEKINSVRVKFLRLVQRLGHSPEETVAAQVLYRLGLAEGMRGGRSGLRPFKLDSARQTAAKLEDEGEDDLEFSCTILLIGKTGVGKSATINSIFGDDRAPTGAFQPTTSIVREITGVVHGMKIRVIDTPGLKPSLMEQGDNRKILSSVKKFTKKFQPDIVLYLDRMDARARDLNDLPLLRSITSYLGASIWFNAIVGLTHASSAPPDGPNGSPLAYDLGVSQRSHAVQHSIRQAAGDMRLMNPVALVENNPSCRRNRAGQQVLPNGQAWRSQLLLLCCSTKILSEANSLLKLQEPFTGKLLFGGHRYQSAPLPFLLSSLLQSRPHPKLASADHGDDIFDSEGESSDAEATDEEGDEYDQLPPFKPLRKSQIAKLSKEQRNAYLEEYEYRVKLLQKKQLKEELRRRRETKRQKQNNQDLGSPAEVDEFEDENGGPATVPVPLPDMVLPPTFDGDNPAYRYRFLEPSGSQLLTRPVLDNHGWDHDCGYDGVSLEENLALAGLFPAGVSVQITKDKKDFNIHVDSSVSIKHGEHGSTLAGFDVQTVGKQLAYIFRSESKFKNFKKNKTAAGLSFTLIGEKLASGIKIEDQISIGKRANLSASAGMIRSQSDVAYGANLEARILEKDYPIGQDSTTLGVSLMRWRRDLALGANLQTQFSVGRGTKTAVRIGLNNKLSGQITVRTSSSEQLQIALMGLLPLAVSMYHTIWAGASQSMH